MAIFKSARARVLSGPVGLCRKVEDAVRKALTRAGDPVAVVHDARAMREKLAAQFPGRDIWDMKHAPGGLIDIEFIVQTLQLCHAPADAGVLDQNTIAALQKLEAAGVHGTACRPISARAAFSVNVPFSVTSLAALRTSSGAT